MMLNEQTKIYIGTLCCARSHEYKSISMYSISNSISVVFDVCVFFYFRILNMNVKVLSRNTQIKKRNHNIDKNFYELIQSFRLKQLEFLNGYIK